jgi:hypothetical protein
MLRLIAVDPGDAYTGVAFFEEDPDEERGWRCVDAQEFEPQEFEDALAYTVIEGEVDIFVYERYRLYEDKAAMQTGSEFLTSQSIGAFKFIIRNHNRHAEAHEEVTRSGGMLTCEMPGGVCHNPAKAPTLKVVTIYGQMADIKKPTRAILKRKGIKSVAKPIATAEYHGRDHVIDAELHGWKYILDQMGK